MRLDHQFILKVIPQAKIIGQILQELSFCVDTRNLVKGDIYVALLGSQVDGHVFIEQAINQGAHGLMINENQQACIAKLSSAIRDQLMIIIVPDTYQALLLLAKIWRQQFSIPIIGITGSVGKTSTKELLAQIVTQAGKSCLASHGTQNTAIGASLNILRMRPQHEVAIFEMGISKRGEMARMADLIRPTCAVITMIGHSHMEGLGSLTDIATEKRDIFKYFEAHNIGIINGDQAILSNISYQHPIIRFGSKTINQIQARKIQSSPHNISFVLKMYQNKYNVIVPTNHQGRIVQGLAAACVAYLLDIPVDIIVRTLQQPLIIQSRFEQRRIKNNKGIIIDDCYNASPESMKAALIAFDQIESMHPKIAVLGDMKELGVNAPFWHRQLGRLLRKAPTVSHVILVGEQVKSVLKTLPLQVTAQVVPSWQEAAALLSDKLTSNSLVLVKGSRGVALDKLVHELCE